MYSVHSVHDAVVGDDEVRNKRMVIEEMKNAAFGELVVSWTWITDHMPEYVVVKVQLSLGLV